MLVARDRVRMLMVGTVQGTSTQERTPIAHERDVHHRMVTTRRAHRAHELVLAGRDDGEDALVGGEWVATRIAGRIRVLRASTAAVAVGVALAKTAAGHRSRAVALVAPLPLTTRRKQLAHWHAPATHTSP